MERAVSGVLVGVVPKIRDFQKMAARDPNRNDPFFPPRVSLGSMENSVSELFWFARSGASSRPVARKVVQKHPKKLQGRRDLPPGCTSSALPPLYRSAVLGFGNLAASHRISKSE